MNKILVCISHELLQEQISDLNTQFNIEQIYLLKQVSPELSSLTQQIPDTFDKKNIIDLSKKIVQLAFNLGCTHFCCLGQPSLSLWTNCYASGLVPLDIDEKKMICIESVTKRIVQEEKMNDGSIVKTSIFKHVRWREMV